MDESKEEKSEAEDAPDRSPEMEIDENGGESLFTGKTPLEKKKEAATPQLTGEGEIAITDKELRNSEEAQRDDAEPEGKEKAKLVENDDRIEHDETDEDSYEDGYFEDAENGKNKNKKKKRKYLFMAILLGVIVSAGFFLWFTIAGNRGRSEGPSLGQQAEQTESKGKSEALDASFISQTTKQHETTSQVEIPEHTAFGLADKLEKANRLRNELLKKQEEIRALKQYYRNSIKEVRNEILNEKREKGITTFQQAIASKQIELRLRTIKRRQLYIHQLDQPLEQLHLRSEELLYMKRLAAIQIQMAPVVKGIDMAELGKRMDIIIEREANGVGSLAIDTEGTGAPSLEEIWKELIHEENMKRQSEREAQKGEKSEKEKSHSQQQDEINSEIWQEICVGNLSRKHELTKLSLKAAKCLSQWEEGKDLFLNRITEIQTPIAGQLSQWKGEWLCLNGITELSPEAAEGLSRWRGTRLSLNGLMELTPQAAKHLSKWGGKEIEVVGLATISSGADKYLAAWQEAGGKIYIRTLP